MQPVVIKIENTSDETIENVVLFGEKADDREEIAYSIICPGHNTLESVFLDCREELMQNIFISTEGPKSYLASEPLDLFKVGTTKQIYGLINPYQTRASFSTIFFRGEGEKITDDLKITCKEFPPKSTYYLTIN